MKLKYFLVKGKSKYLSIYVRFWDSKRYDQKTKTGITVKYSDWSIAKQRIRLRATTENVDLLNDKLNKLEDYIYSSYIKDYSNNEYISKDWLKESVKTFFGRVNEDEGYKIYFVEWIEKFVKTAHTRIYRGKPIKPRSIKNYNAALGKLKKFEAHKNKKYRFEDIDLSFHRDFILYCSDVENLNQNTIGSLISRIKTFCREIEFEGYSVNPLYKSNNFYSPKNETYDVYLNNDEINAIYNKDFSKNTRLDNVRDLFIIGLRTGLRISDFLRISEENIIGELINITTQKTNQNLTIPIHPQVKSILKKRKGALPNKISDQKFNLYIKEVCKESEINKVVHGLKRNEATNRKTAGNYPKYELVTSHICRRSFATNLFLDGFDNVVIMKATGHKSEKQFLEYIKATDEEHLKKLSEYWKNH